MSTERYKGGGREGRGSHNGKQPGGVPVVRFIRPPEPQPVTPAPGSPVYPAFISPPDWGG